MDNNHNHKIIYVARNSLAWDAAWDGLRHTLIADGLGNGSDIVQYYDGEAWQYMGSYTTLIGMGHEFRHRFHPRTKAREHRTILTPLLEAESANKQAKEWF